MVGAGEGNFVVVDTQEIDFRVVGRQARVSLKPREFTILFDVSAGETFTDG
jgi:hypothetical protein